MLARIEKNGTRVTLHLQGRLDDMGASHLTTHFSALSTGTWPVVVLDMSRVNFVGSTAIGRFLRLQEALTRRQAQLYLVNVPASIQALFATMHLDRVLNLGRS